MMAGSKSDTSDSYTIMWFAEASEEYKELDNSQKIIVDKGIHRIKRDGANAGEELHRKLRGCRKIKHRKAGLRIVFRVSSAQIEIMEIIAIGKREDKVVYQDAEKRLKR